MILPEWIVLYLAVAGCGCLILGLRKVGVGLLLPAGLRWLLLPLVKSELQHLPVLVFVSALPIVAVFGGLFILDRVVSLIYGPRAGGHVTGTYLVRVLDATGRGILWTALLPFKLLGRRWRIPRTD